MFNDNMLNTILFFHPTKVNNKTTVATKIDPNQKKIFFKKNGMNEQNERNEIEIGKNKNANDSWLVGWLAGSWMQPSTDTIDRPNIEANHRCTVYL